MWMALYATKPSNRVLRCDVHNQKDEFPPIKNAARLRINVYLFFPDINSSWPGLDRFSRLLKRVAFEATVHMSTNPVRTPVVEFMIMIYVQSFWPLNRYPIVEKSISSASDISFIVFQHLINQTSPINKITSCIFPLNNMHFRKRTNYNHN